MSITDELCDLGNEIIDNWNDYIPQHDSYVYHYTSPSGIQGIMNNNKLRFTDRNFLNDYSEGVYVLDLCINSIDKIDGICNNFRNDFLKKCKERKKNLQSDNFYVYQCSFSIDEDNLGLWNYYTKGDSICGYNLCFIADEDMIRPSIRENIENKPQTFLGKIIYDEDEQIRIVKKMYKKFYDLYDRYKPNNYYSAITEKLVDKLMLLGIFFKKKCFSIENEFRIALDLHRKERKDKFSAICEQQQFFVKNGFLIPYVDIGFESSALKEIRVSPTVDFDTAKRSLIRAAAKNFKQIKESDIKQSEIPVRY